MYSSRQMYQALKRYLGRRTCRVLRKKSRWTINRVLVSRFGTRLSVLRRVVLWCFLIFSLLLIFYPSTAARFFWEDYQNKHARYTGTLVRDSRGNFVGLIPGALTGEPTPYHKALLLKEVPPVWWKILTALEDQSLDKDSWEYWYGINFSSLLWALPSQFSDEKRGASTLPMMLVRSMHHYNPAAGNWLKKIKRKLIELRDAPVLSYQLGIAGMKKWLGTHVLLAQGAPGSRMGQPLYGLEVSARILFGKRPMDLNMAQQAILAAAFKKPILLSPNKPDKGYEVAKERWQLLKKRALLGLRLAYGKDNAQVLEAAKILQYMPLPQPKGPVSLYPRLPDDPRERFTILANPERRTLYFAKGEIIQAIDELRHRYGTNWSTQVDEIQLTLDTRKNSVFKHRLEKRLAKIEAQLGRRLELPLLPNKVRSPARILLAVTNEKGELVLYYNNQSFDGSFSDGAAGFAIEKAPYEPGAYPQIGSVGKLFSMMELVRQGDGPDTLYCNQRYANVHNANGKTGWKHCKHKKAWKSARDVIAYSMNLPIIWRLKNRTSESDLKNLIDLFGFDVPVNPGALHTALPLGTIEVPPVRLLKAIGDIGLELQGKPSMPVYPHIIKIENKPAGKRRLQNYFATLRQRRALKEIFSAPLEYGTLSALRDWSASRKGEVSLHIAKTGTTTWPDGRIREKIAVGFINYRDQNYAYIVIVGSMSKKHPLGKNISSNRLLAPMIKEALQTL